MYQICLLFRSFMGIPHHESSRASTRGDVAPWPCFCCLFCLDGREWESGWKSGKRSVNRNPRKKGIPGKYILIYLIGRCLGIWNKKFLTFRKDKKKRYFSSCCSKEKLLRYASVFIDLVSKMNINKRERGKWKKR